MNSTFMQIELFILTDSNCPFVSRLGKPYSNRVQQPLDTKDTKSFPVLSSTTTKAAPGSLKNASESPWSPPNTSRLVEGFSATDKPKIPPNSEKSMPADSFPQLSSHAFKQ